MNKEETISEIKKISEAYKNHIEAQAEKIRKA